MLKKLGHMARGFSTCRGAGSFLLDYVEGRLNEKTSRKFEEHIAMCPNCKHYLEQYKSTIQLVKGVPPPEPPPELADMTCAFIREALDIKDSEAS